MTGEGPAATEAAAVVNRVRAALAADEIVTSIGKALRDADSDAFAWLHPPACHRRLGHGRQRPCPPPAPPSPGKGGHGIRRAGEDDEALLAGVRGLPRRPPERRRRRHLAGARMTAAAPLAPVSLSMILAMIEQASGSRFNYRDGVIGLLAQPDRSARADVQHNGQLVRIRPAESALAVREALTEHRDGDWMVILTDRSDEDLGDGIRAHLVWNRLRRPDPWGAVRHRFKATGIDPSLTAGARQPRPRHRAAGGHPEAGLAGGPGRGAHPVARPGLAGPGDARPVR